MSEAERLAQALEGAFHAWEHPSNEVVLKAAAELRRLQRELGLADSMYKLVVLERDQAYREVEALRKAAERYRSALVWALGAGDDFKPQGTMQGKYWWRGELAERAGLEWRGTEFIDHCAARPGGEG